MYRLQNIEFQDNKSNHPTVRDRIAWQLYMIF